MRPIQLSRLVAPTLAVAAMQLTTGCGSDDPTDPNDNNGNTIVASWTATSLTAPSQPQWGDGVVDDGLSVIITFNANGTHSWSVSTDFPADTWICHNTASCSWTGTYSVTGNTILWDEGTADEASATYSISGSTLTMTFAASAQVNDPYRYVMRKN